MLKILHTADNHIGTRQYGLEERRNDFSQAWLQVIDIAIEEDVAAVIHSGDLFDDRNPSAEDLQDALQGLFKLKEAGIKFMGIVGNHEHRRGVQWLDLFASLDLAFHLTMEPNYIDEIPVYGLDYSGRQKLQLPRLPGGILVAHQLIDKVSPKSELKFSELLDCGAKIILLGDYHEYKAWQEHDVLITYAGSTERWSLEEKPQRTCSIINLAKANLRLEQRELTTRKFIYIAEDEDPLKGIEEKDVKDAIVCVYLARADYPIAEIEEYGKKRGALAVQVRDRRESSSPKEIEVSVEFGDLDSLVSERLDRMELLKITREIDAIIRDERIVDSNVDPEVSKVLEEQSKV